MLCKDPYSRKINYIINCQKGRAYISMSSSSASCNHFVFDFQYHQQCFALLCFFPSSRAQCFIGLNLFIYQLQGPSHLVKTKHIGTELAKQNDFTSKYPAFLLIFLVFYIMRNWIKFNAFIIKTTTRTNQGVNVPTKS